MFGRSLATAVAVTLILFKDAQATRSGHSRVSENISRSDYRFLNEITQRMCYVLEKAFTTDQVVSAKSIDSSIAHLVESLPDVHFDLGEMYSGSIPVRENASLFYIFQPKIGEPSDDLTIWLSGGPGCSSMQGFLQENGRFTWQPGTYKPVVNEYAWVNLTNMLWVDQPVGTGFSVGTPTAKDEQDIAVDFVHFLTQFQKLYNIRNFRIFMSGESYAGRYVPYISAAMLDKNDTEHFDLSGALMYDACIGQWDWIQAELPAYPFVQQHSELFNFNSSFMKELQSTYEECGYEAYFDKYFTYPASEVQPAKYINYSVCDIYNMIYYEAYDPNPCWSPYRVSQTCPLLWDVLGFPTDLAYEPAPTTYFNRTDVKKALHAPESVQWELCSSESVFVGDNPGPEQQYDTSLNPTEGVLPRIIEATNRVLISNGDWDYLVITNGTLLAIQNMTWNGELGFQTRPATPINIEMPDLQWSAIFDAQDGYGGLDGPQGLMGIQHYERGLMFAETFQAGHRQASDQGRVSYRHVQWMLGEIDSL